MSVNLQKPFWYIGLVVLALSLMAFAPGAWPAQTPDGDQFVLGDNYVLNDGETLNGNLIVLGGNARLEGGSTVEGDVVVMGGNLHAAGAIDGDVNVIGGQVTLDAGAVVRGDVNTLSSNLVRDDGARVEGDINTDLRFPFFFSAPATIPLPEIGNLPAAPATSVLHTGINFIGKAIWWVGRSFIWALLALVAMLFVPRQTEQVAGGMKSAPVQSGLMGLLTVLTAPPVLALVAITICGIPFAFVGALVLVVAWALGIVALGLETGRRLAAMLQQDWAPTVDAAVGTFLLTLLINGVAALVPCIGWLVPFTVGLIGLGAVVLTRFGGQVFPPADAMVGAPAAAAATAYIDEPHADPEPDVAQDEDLPPA